MQITISLVCLGKSWGDSLRGPVGAESLRRKRWGTPLLAPILVVPPVSRQLPAWSR